MNTPAHLRSAATLLGEHGLHTGDRFVAADGSLDVCAALYQGATGGSLPDAFRTDDTAAIGLIKASTWTMAAIRAVYDSLGPEATIPDEDGPDEVIDRVIYWAATAPDAHSQPPTRLEVMGRLLRVANSLEQQAALAA
ncbi:hypothetical protein [Streptomyces sp. NPDC001404]|uniref:hypothetical protein n=1 Tax=Streptomyces sp. NPDC001404 TaxID=3364571 RepID=UPI0036852A93